MTQKFTVTAVQAAPAYLDLPGSLALAEKWIAEAGRQGARLAVFPETWLPGYPVWLDLCPSAALWNHPPTKAVFRRTFENSVEVPSPATGQLCRAARAAHVFVVMGLNERVGGTLYNSLLYISDAGEIIGRHRKLTPTYTERMVWGMGDGSTLTVIETPLGRIGGLVCWEHWMPLARQAMHAQRETIHAAAWPSVHEMHQVASRSYAFEGRTFVVACGGVLTPAHLPQDLALLKEMPPDRPWMTGGSAIVGPDGQYLAGPAGSEETLVLAEIDPAQITEELMTLDVSGHYARPDVFSFEVNSRTKGTEGTQGTA